VPKFGLKVPHLWCDSRTSFKVKRSRSLGPLMLTHIVRHIFRTARPTNFKLGTRMADDDPHQPQAPWPPRSKVKVARSRDLFEPSLPNAVPVTLAAGGAYRVGWTRRPHYLFASEFRPRSASTNTEHKTVRQLENLLDPSGSGTMPLPVFQNYHWPRVTLTFDLLTPKVDRFMRLSHEPLVPVGVKIGSNCKMILCHIND